MRQVALVLFAVLLVGCADSDQIEFSVDDSAKPSLSSLPGRIGIAIHGRHSLTQGVLVGGVLEQPHESIKAPAEDLESILVTLSPRPEGYLRRPYSLSPDRRYVAAGLEAQTPRTAIPHRFVIIDRGTNRDRAIISFEGPEAVKGLAWSPDSSLVAALSLTERGRISLMNTLSAISGHPVRYNTYYLTIYDISGRVVARTRLAEDVPASVTHLVWTN